MVIAFSCGHCGKRIEAPDEAGGKRGKCPYCKQSNYIPTPVKDEELFELAPEDEQEEQRRRQEQEQLRRRERELLSESGADESKDVPLTHREDLGPEDVQHLVVNYCLDLAGSKLERAEASLNEMKKVRHMVRQVADDFASGKALEPALAHIPTKVLQSFLTQLKKALG